MSRLRAFAKGASIAGVASVALGGVAYTAQRLALSRLRRTADPSPASVLAPLQFPLQSMASFDGGTINFVDIGSRNSPTTFVLSHGVTLSIRTWVLQLASLESAGFRVIAFDHRGHGASRMGTGGFSVDGIGDDVATLLSTLQLHNVVLVGHSMGGIAVQSYLARHRADAEARLTGVVLLSTLPSALAGSQAARFGQVVERVTRRTPDSTRLWANPQIGMLLARFGFGRDPLASHVELVRQMMHACARDTRVHGPRSLIGFNLVDALAKIAVPTLIIGGTADVITPPKDSMRMHQAIPGSRLEMLEGGGHMLMLERSEIVNQLLIDFASAHVA